MCIKTHRRAAGFTLIELMVVVVILGILAAVAYPAMTSSIQRSRRADAAAALTAIVQAQERYRSNHSAYAKVIGDGGLGMDASKISKHYGFELTSPDDPTFASGYLLTATPKADGPQAKDTTCATLGIKLKSALFTYVSTDSSGKDSSEICWAR